MVDDDLKERRDRQAAARIDEVSAATGALMIERFQHLTHLEKAMGAALTAAHEVFHDHATEEDFVAVARAAWRRTVEGHKHGPAH